MQIEDMDYLFVNRQFDDVQGLRRLRTLYFDSIEVAIHTYKKLIYAFVIYKSGVFITNTEISLLDDRLRHE